MLVGILMPFTDEILWNSPTLVNSLITVQKFFKNTSRDISHSDLWLLKGLMWKCNIYNIVGASGEGFPGGSVLKNPPAIQKIGVWSVDQQDLGEGNGNLLQCSCLGNPIDRRTWWPIVHGVTKSWAWLCD